MSNKIFSFVFLCMLVIKIFFLYLYILWQLNYINSCYWLNWFPVRTSDQFVWRGICWLSFSVCSIMVLTHLLSPKLDRLQENLLLNAISNLGQLYLVIKFKFWIMWIIVLQAEILEHIWMKTYTIVSNTENICLHRKLLQW